MKVIGYLALALLLTGAFVVGCSKDSDQTADALNEEAVRLVQAGSHVQALEMATAALEKSEKENGADHPKTITSLEIMGFVYQTMGDSSKAESALLRALSIVKKFHGPNHAESAKIMNNLGGIYYAQNQYVMAASFFKQSLAILEKDLPENDPRLSTLRKNIEVCENMQDGGGSEQTSESHAIAGGLSSAALTQANAPENSLQESSVNLTQDLVPQQVKDSMVSQLAEQNILIFDIEPRQPVLIKGKGIVFPYHALKKVKDTDAVQEIVVLFAAVKNPEKPDALVFQQCRLISHTSYVAALEKGGMAQLTNEIKEVFPNLYL